MAGELVREMSSVAADSIMFVAEIGEELPVFRTVLRTLSTVGDKVKAARSNPDDLAALHNRCTYITAYVINKYRQGSFDLDVTPLEECITAVGRFVDRCSRRGMVTRVLKASGDRDEIAGLKERVEDLERDLGLAGLVTVGERLDDLKALLLVSVVVSCIPCVETFLFLRQACQGSPKNPCLPLRIARHFPTITGHMAPSYSWFHHLIPRRHSQHEVYDYFGTQSISRRWTLNLR